MIVRSIQPHEIDVTVNLCNYYKDEAGITDEEYDQNAVIDTIRTHTIHPEYIWLNAYEGQRPIGLIAGCITKAPWSNQIIYGHIELVFLIESHRNMDNFRELVSKFTEWAKTNKAVKITAGDIGINIERSKKIYEHLGFEQGLWMSKEI